MTTDQNIISALWKYGYLPDVVTSDLPLLKIDHAVIVDALARYQDFCHRPLNGIVLKHHGRELIPDGDVGPATREMFSLERCEVPDFGPGSGRELKGAGSWPLPCQKQGVKIFFNWSGVPAGVLRLKSKERWEAEFIELWRLVGLKLIKVATKAEANIDFYFRAFFGGTIGMASFNNRTCGDTVFCSMSTNYVWQDIGLPKHESGHCMNFPHTRGGTMNSYILKEEHPLGYWLKSDPSWPLCLRFFDGVPVGEPGPGPIPPPDDPLPPPVPPDDPAPGPRRPLLDFLRWLFGW